MVEQVDKEFIQDHWTDDEGNLYKYVWPQFPDPDPYVAALKTNAKKPDVSRMLALYETLQTVTDATFVADVGPAIDLDLMARYLAVDRTISNGNGISGFYCFDADAAPVDCGNSNFYWYEAPGGFSSIIPWDLDYTFNDVNTDLGRRFNEASDCKPVPFCEYLGLNDCDTEGIFFLPPQCDPLYGGIHRATWDAYVAAALELARGPMSPEVLTPQLEAIRAKIRDAVAADPFGPGLEAFDQANADLYRTVRTRSP